MTLKTAQSAHRHRGTSRTPSVPPCQQEFLNGQAARKKYPLLTGAYKLRELRLVLDQVDETIQDIMELLQGRRPRDAGLAIGWCCTTEDKAQWLKGLPKEFAWDVGYYLLPGVAALAGDGLTEGQVARLLAYAKHHGERIVADCEELHKMLRATVKHEYTLMQHGGSNILPVIRRLRSAIDKLLKAASPTR